MGAFVESMARDAGASARGVERQFFAIVRPSSLLKRFETPDEVGRDGGLRLQRAASATNGAALRVDGGVVRSIV